MTLMTCCIHCRTVFRVTREQLQARDGQVRCGRCRQVFNGLATLASPDSETLIAVSDAAAPASAVPVAMSAPAAPDVPLQADVPATDASATAEVADALPPSAATSPESAWTSNPEPAPESSSEVPALVVDPEPLPVVEAELSSADNPFAQSPAPTARSRQPLLVAASVLLAVSLAAQAVYFYRGEVAAQHPLLRQWLTAACAQAGCTMPLPQRPKAVIIEASDLQIADPAIPGRIQLTATLRNHAEHEVAYPALDLVLTNVNDHTLARRIFMPAEYLEKDRSLQAGLAANAELTVRLALDTGNLGAAGFRLAVLAAPQR